MKRSYPTFVAVILTLCMASCETTGADCGGITELKESHRERLTCAGWLDYVDRNVCTIEYVDRITPETTDREVLGRAFCGDDKIVVATQEVGILGRNEPLNPFEITATIVHEAAHLADDCQNGEAPAIEAEQAYFKAFDSKECIILTR